MPHQVHQRSTSSRDPSTTARSEPEAGGRSSALSAGYLQHYGSRLGVGAGGLDALSQGGHVGDPKYLDDAGSIAAGAVAGGALGAAIGGVPGALIGGAVGAVVGGALGAAGPAVPVHLVQTDTGWTGGADKYGFQLSFTCGSSSGRVADLQSQAGLRWREYVTYQRNDFAHRISPNNPTILPPGGGIPFTAPSAVATNATTISFPGTTDTHWTPVDSVVKADFLPGATPPRALPAIMQSTQLYQYSTDGSSWTTFAGPFRLTRTLAQSGANFTFTTNKAGVRAPLVEAYKGT